MYLFSIAFRRSKYKHRDNGETGTFRAVDDSRIQVISEAETLDLNLRVRRQLRPNQIDRTFNSAYIVPPA